MFVKEQTVSEICVIAPTEALAKRTEEILQQSGEQIDVYVASLGDAEHLAGELSERGARIFISRKGTKAYIERSPRFKVVGINYTLEDYIQPLKQLGDVHGKLGFLNYRGYVGNVPELQLICRMLGIPIGIYSFSSARDAAACVENAIADGITAAIGGVITEQEAEKRGLRHIVLENSSASIRNAIEAAKQLLELQKEEEKKNMDLSVQLRRNQLILDYTHDGILSTDEFGNVVLLNEAARKLFPGCTKEELMGKPIQDILPNTCMPEVLSTGRPELDQFMDIGEVKVSTNRMPIVVDGKIYGVVATFRDIKSIQNTEKKYRMKLHEKGLVAKLHLDDIQGSAPAIRHCRAMAASYARSDSTVLIHGETGSGKEMFAQGIHNASRRAMAPFVAINCAALSRDLLEAELFGYEDGAFTGASKGGKAGLFEVAHGGTVFLDEIGEVSPEVQVQLLRVLQEKEIRRIGSDRITPVDIRVVTATNRDLAQAVADGTFRQDLYYRLNVLNIRVPPLRERQEDVRDIAVSILREVDKYTTDEKIWELSDLLAKVRGYPWPGNVRELHNFVERYCALKAVGEVESLNFLAEELLDGARSAPSASARECGAADQERERLLDALRQSGGRIEKAAQLLGISRTTLWRKMKEHHLEK